MVMADRGECQGALSGPTGLFSININVDPAGVDVTIDLYVGTGRLHIEYSLLAFTSCEDHSGQTDGAGEPGHQLGAPNFTRLEH